MTPLQMRMARAALQINQTDLAHAIGVTAPAISRFESEEVGRLSLTTVQRAERYFIDNRVRFGRNGSVRLQP